MATLAHATKMTQGRLLRHRFGRPGAFGGVRGGLVQCEATAMAESVSTEEMQERPRSLAPGVMRYAAPAATEVSLWHDVDLHVKTWLDEDTGLLRFVNEMPLGSLQKFEVQPDVLGNAIVEDPAGSSRLAEFGKVVPFNYGCFPQTYRDPDQVDELYAAPGDDDPLDVVELGGQVRGVGEVVECRPLGAVLLLDEGRADWKILTVSTSGGPLAEARSVEDVERIAPGRIQECLTWMDDFKQSKDGDQATLHFKIHDAAHAAKLIEEDHASWQKLVASAGPDGLAGGHWIRAAGSYVTELPKAVAMVSWSRIAKQRDRTPIGFKKAGPQTSLVQASLPVPAVCA